jgi:hypothetical protein
MITVTAFISAARWIERIPDDFSRVIERRDAASATKWRRLISLIPR